MTDFAKARTAMVDRQVRPSDVTTYAVIEAMLTVPREEFVPTRLKSVAYADRHVELASGRYLTDPRTTAKMIDALRLGPNDLVLNIGAGTGYVAALAGQLAAAVIALEEDESLAAEAARVLPDIGADNVVVEQGVLSEGKPSHAPFDAILVAGGIARFPEALEAQLSEGGRAVAIFMDGPLGQCRLGVKSGGRVSWRRVFDATAPLLPGFAAAQEFQF